MGGWKQGVGHKLGTPLSQQLCACRSSSHSLPCAPLWLQIALLNSAAAAAATAGLWAASPPLLATLGGSLALGLAYSTDLPFLRWKRWPLVAAGCILAVRLELGWARGHRLGG